MDAKVSVTIQMDAKDTTLTLMDAKHKKYLRWLTIKQSSLILGYKLQISQHYSLYKAKKPKINEEKSCTKTNKNHVQNTIN